MSIIASETFTKELIEAGIVPQYCTAWTLSLEAGEPVRITAEVFVTEEQAKKLKAIFGKHKDLLTAAYGCNVVGSSNP